MRINLLVVDDERFAVQGITKGIDWTDLPVENIYEAFDVATAKRIIQEQRIDVMISDIQMPGENGLELLEWVRNESPATETIFLTGHADFSYAQQAIHLGSFDYVLKPVDHDQLKAIVGQAIEKIKAERELLDFNETYRTYYMLWLNQLPLLVERFWQDVLAHRTPLTAERLALVLQQYHLPLRADSKVRPILISVEEWHEELSAQDEEIMEYAVRKAAAELIVKESPGIVFQDRGEINLALLYEEEGGTLPVEDARSRCEAFIHACMNYFHCDVSCYIGEPVAIGELGQGVQELMQLERGNVSETRRVITQADGEPTEGQVQGFPPFADWTTLLELGKKEELLARVEEWLLRIRQEGVSEMLEALYFGILHMLYDTAHRKGLSVRDMIGSRDPEDASVFRSVQQLRTWVLRLLSAAADYISSHHKEVSAVIAKVQAYVAGHLHEEMTREDIASAVYLNAAYLSRLFRKETGMSLSDYILGVRMERAKKLLTESNDKISSIAEAAGYIHFSHFTKMFKKYTGLTPQEYRKNVQDA